MEIWVTPIEERDRLYNMLEKAFVAVIEQPPQNSLAAGESDSWKLIVHVYWRAGIGVIYSDIENKEDCQIYCRKNVFVINRMQIE